MRNPGNSDHEKVRINFARSVLNAASHSARSKGLTLSGYIEGLVLEDLGMPQLALCHQDDETSPHKKSSR